MIKMIILLLIAGLWRLGGWNKAKWSGYRDVLIPIILGLYIGWEYHWLVGFLTIGSFQIIRMGYGSYDPINDPKPSFLAKMTHDKEGWIIRGIVGFLYGFVGLLPLFVYWVSNGLVTDNFLLKWAEYCILNLFIGGVLCRLKTKDFIIEPAIGAGVASLIFIF